MAVVEGGCPTPCKKGKENVRRGICPGGYVQEKKVRIPIIMRTEMIWCIVVSKSEDAAAQGVVKQNRPRKPACRHVGAGRLDGGYNLWISVSKCQQHVIWSSTAHLKAIQPCRTALPRCRDPVDCSAALCRTTVCLYLRKMYGSWADVTSFCRWFIDDNEVRHSSRARHLRLLSLYSSLPCYSDK